VVTIVRSCGVKHPEIAKRTIIYQRYDCRTSIGPALFHFYTYDKACEKSGRRRHFNPEQIVHMLRESEIKLDGGKTTGEVCRELGISAYYHDSAAAIIRNGEVVAAAQEERFTRKKHDSRFPSHAIEYCLSESDIKLSDLSKSTFYDRPLIRFERLLETYLSYAPKGFRSFFWPPCRFG
jgi:hypothetical protein